MPNFIVETYLHESESLTAHGRRFTVRRADDSKILAKGHLTPDAEVVIRSGVVPDEATQAELEKYAREAKKSAKVATADAGKSPADLLDEARHEKNKGDLQKWAKKHDIKVDGDEQTRDEMEAIIAAHLGVSAEDEG